MSKSKNPTEHYQLQVWYEDDGWVTTSTHRHQWVLDDWKSDLLHDGRPSREVRIINAQGAVVG